VLFALISALKGRYTAAFECTAVAICFKETAWLTYPLIPLVGQLGNKRITQMGWPALCTGVVTSAILMLVKLHVGGNHLQTGSNFTSNGAWLPRYLKQVLGWGFNKLLSADWPPTMLGVLISGLIVSSNRRSERLTVGLLAASMIACLVGEAVTQHVGLDVALAMMADPSSQLPLIIAAIVYFAFYFIGIRRNRSLPLLGVMLFCFAFESLTVIVNPKQTGHIYYIPSAFLDIALATVTVNCIEQLMRILLLSAAQRRKSTMSPEPELADAAKVAPAR
jgi:hypothetical protein